MEKGVKWRAGEKRKSQKKREIWRKIDRKRKRGEGEEGDGKRENDEMSTMMKVACVCVVNARIQLFCDYNATGDWTVG